MGIGGISIWQLLIILAIVIMIFGTKKLKTLGSDLGGAVKGFRQSMSDEGKDKSADDVAMKAESVEDAGATTTAETVEPAKTAEKEKA